MTTTKDGGEVLAEALAAVEPELVDRVDAVGVGGQRVGVAPGGDVAHQRPRDRLRAGGVEAAVAAEGGGPLERARVEAGRQGEVGRELRPSPERVRAESVV